MTILASFPCVIQEISQTTEGPKVTLQIKQRFVEGKPSSSGWFHISGIVEAKLGQRLELQLVDDDKV